jgi:hypothetical protein
MTQEEKDKNIADAKEKVEEATEALAVAEAEVVE